MFRSQDAGARISVVLAFLYLCENEGLCISELAAVADLTMATASRAARSLLAPGAKGALAPALGLAELRPQGKTHALFLTKQGHALRAGLDRTIAAAVLIG